MLPMICCDTGVIRVRKTTWKCCLLSGCCWRRIGAGDIFLTHFGPLSRNWLPFRHTDDKHTPVRPRGAIFWWRTTQHDTKSESSEAAEFIFAESSQKSQCVATWRPHHKSAANKTGWCCQHGLKCQQGCLSDSLKLWHKWSRRIKWLQWMENFSFFTVSQRELCLKMVRVTDSVRHSEHKTVYPQRLHPLPVHWLEMGNKLYSFRIKE